MASRLRRIARATRDGLLILVITLALLEALLWIFYPAGGPEVHHRFTQTLHGVKPEITYEVNGFGVRSLSMKTRARPPRTLRLLAVGASTTDQATQETADTWAGLLERRLAARFADRNLRVEVVAYGRGGETAFDTLAWTRENALDLEPSAVVTLLGINDLAWHGGPTYRYTPGSRDHALRERAVRSCRRFSQVCRWSLRIVDQVRMRWAIARGDTLDWHSENIPGLRAHYAGLPARDPPVRDPDPLREFSDGADDLLGFLEANQVPALVVAQPVLWRADLPDADRALLWFPIRTPDGEVRPSPAWLAREMQRFNDAQRAIAARHGARYVDPRLPATRDNFFDDCHFTDAGNRALADALYPAAAALLDQAAARIP